MTSREHTGTRTPERGWSKPRGEHKRRHTEEEVAAKLRHVGALVGKGMLLTNAIRQIGVAQSTYYRWRADHHAPREQNEPDPDQVQRLHGLEVENTRLRRAVAELVIEKQALKEVVSGTT